MAFQVRFQNGKICAGQISYGKDPQIFQGFHTGMTAHEQTGDGKRPHFFFDFPGIEGMHQVGLLEIRGHFSQYLSVGDAYIDSKAEVFEDGVLKKGSSPFRRRVMGGDGRKVHIAFVNAGLFDIRTDA